MFILRIFLANHFHFFRDSKRGKTPKSLEKQRVYNLVLTSQINLRHISWSCDGQHELKYDGYSKEKASLYIMLEHVAKVMDLRAGEACVPSGSQHSSGPVLQLLGFRSCSSQAWLSFLAVFWNMEEMNYPCSLPARKQCSEQASAKKNGERHVVRRWWVGLQKLWKGKGVHQELALKEEGYHLNCWRYREEYSRSKKDLKERDFKKTGYSIGIFWKLGWEELK